MIIPTGTSLTWTKQNLAEVQTQSKMARKSLRLPPLFDWQMIPGKGGQKTAGQNCNEHLTAQGKNTHPASLKKWTKKDSGR